MPKKKPKVLKTKVKDPKFIRFSKVQQGYISELQNRLLGELNRAIESVYEDLGIMEKTSKMPPGALRLRRDCSGVDVVSLAPPPVPDPSPPPPDPPADPPAKDSKDIKPPEKETEPQK